MRRDLPVDIARKFVRTAFFRARDTGTFRALTAFTLSDAARIVKVPTGRLRYWGRTALVVPTGNIGTRAAYAFRDLVSVRSVLDLMKRGVSIARIRRSVEAFRVSVPDLERPLDALRLWGSEPERVVVRHSGALIEPDGQAVFDFFETPETGGAALEFGRLERRVVDVADGAPTRARSAEAIASAVEWFERGCQLDGQRSTHADAIEAYLRAIEIDPDYADAHCNLGSVYYNRDRRDTARACFERALEIEPGHVEANLNIATLLEDEGSGESALRHYKTALRSDPLFPDTHVSLALLYERLELPRRAREHWRRYLQLEPSGAWSDVARKRLE